MITFSAIALKDVPSGDRQDLQQHTETLHQLRSLLPFARAIVAAGLFSDGGMTLVDGVVSTIANKTPHIAAEQQALEAFCERRETADDRIASGGPTDYTQAPSEVVDSIAVEYGELGYLLGLVVGATLGADALGLRGGK